MEDDGKEGEEGAGGKEGWMESPGCEGDVCGGGLGHRVQCDVKPRLTWLTLLT